MAARVYSLSQRRFIDCGQDDAPCEIGPDVIWLDLLNPTPKEEGLFEQQVGINLPMREELKDIEPSSRLYREGGALYMTATIVAKADTQEPEAVGMGFILKGGLFITIRYSEPRALMVFSDHMVRKPEDYRDGRAVMCGLLEAIVDRAAEVMERLAIETDSISLDIFSNPSTDKAARARRKKNGGSHAQTLKKIAFHQNLMSKVRDSLVSLGRVVRFLGFMEVVKDQPAQEELLKSIDRDISALNDQASFLSSSISFLLNASLGLINIEQNSIIKFFSVVAVVFLPPTLIASIYGMNFGFMPELHWHLGYPIALGLMFASAIGPYLWFKYKRWL